MSLPTTTPGKNVLVVLSHPEATSFNHALAATTRATLEATGHSVVVSDLYAMGFDPVNDRRNFISCKDPNRFSQQGEEDHATSCSGFNAEIQAEMDKIVWCDYMIFHCPIHWFGLPAMLKGWCDKVLARGFAYGGGKWYDSGKFLGKKALLCMTTGAPEFMYKADHIQGDIRDIVFPVTHGIFWFCGFTPLQSHFVYSAGHGTETERAGHLSKWRALLEGIESAPAIRYRGFTEVVSQAKEQEAPSPVMRFYQKCFCGAVESGTNGTVL
jgi:NAD(P)H dehydrogenase (quinone)